MDAAEPSRNIYGPHVTVVTYGRYRRAYFLAMVTRERETKMYAKLGFEDRVSSSWGLRLVDGNLLLVTALALGGLVVTLFTGL